MPIRTLLYEDCPVCGKEEATTKVSLEPLPATAAKPEGLREDDKQAGYYSVCDSCHSKQWVRVYGKQAGYRSYAAYEKANNERHAEDRASRYTKAQRLAKRRQAAERAGK